WPSATVSAIPTIARPAPMLRTSPKSAWILATLVSTICSAFVAKDPSLIGSLVALVVKRHSANPLAVKCSSFALVLINAVVVSATVNITCAC
ncbi:hypothetical protein DFQ26_002733, partial [Actinomortierella ambigua]